VRAARRGRCASSSFPSRSVLNSIPPFTFTWRDGGGSCFSAKGVAGSCFTHFCLCPLSHTRAHTTVWRASFSRPARPWRVVGRVQLLRVDRMDDLALYFDASLNPVYESRKAAEEWIYQVRANRHPLNHHTCLISPSPPTDLLQKDRQQLHSLALALHVPQPQSLSPHTAGFGAAWLCSRDDAAADGRRCVTVCSACR
jgi:hypothetical protein